MDPWIISSRKAGGSGIVGVHSSDVASRFVLSAIAPAGVFALVFFSQASDLSPSLPPDQVAVLLLGVVTTGVASNHPARVRIIAHLSILPGDHFRAIVRMLGLGMGNTRHHLNVLEDNGLLRIERHGGKIRYYLMGAGSDSERNELFAKHWSYRDMRLRVLYATRNQGDATPGSVAAALGISRQLAAYHMASLVDLGLLKKEGRRYHP